MSDLLTVADAHERSGRKISEYRIRELVKEGRVECIRTKPDGERGGRILFTEEQYRQLLAALTVPAKELPARQRRQRRRSA